MENMFQEILGKLLEFFIGVLTGGSIGYIIGVKNNQKSGENSKQIQNTINFNKNVTAKKNMNIGNISDDK